MEYAVRVTHSVSSMVLNFIRIRLVRAGCFVLLLAIFLFSMNLDAMAKEEDSSKAGETESKKSEVRQTFQIYYATTRLNEGSEKSPEYSGERHLDMGDGTVEYGIAGLKAPLDYKSPATAESGRQYRKLLRQDADDWRKADFSFVSKTDDEEFFKRLREWNGPICIYLHGYDKPFVQAAEDASMVFYDYQQYETSPQKKLLGLVFSWPSVGGRTEYGTDEANLEWSGPAFDNFLDRVLKEKNPNATLDIVAHSMGVRFVISYLSSRQAQFWDHPLFRNLFLCSGDIDFLLVEMKKAMLDHAVSNRVYIFVSDKDKAMIVSHFVHEQPRLGRPIDPPKFTLAQRSQVFSSVYLEQFAVDTSDLLGGNSYTEHPDVQRWLAENPLLDQEFSEKSRFFDVTELVTKDFGHGVPFSIITAYMAGKGTPQLREQVVHKRPDRTTLKQCGGKPKRLYRFIRLDPDTNSTK